MEKNMKYEFLNTARVLNEKLDMVPLLYGSLGLEKRLHTDLNADDIDVLIPEVFLNDRWESIVGIMTENGYALYDPQEHAFEKNGVSMAFASIEDLISFAGVDIENIPRVEESGIRYLLLDLSDYLKVYTASLKDGYRKDVKNKNDEQKIELINKALVRKDDQCIQVKFYDSADDSLLKYAVIISRSKGKWVFCKHKERNTWEIPGGHREYGESIDITAKRELREETGAADFTIEPVCVYSVTGKNRVNSTGVETYGMLYYADITRFEAELHSEMEKVILLDGMPDQWTYPMIQPLLIEEFEKRNAKKEAEGGIIWE